ncbi:MAG: DUF4388 domain-containing protein [Kofleriaceae bacterium]
MTAAPILAGTLQDLDLSMVMDVTSLGRQMLRLEVTHANGSMIGYVVLKAGRVISAHAGNISGPSALAAILNADGTARFRVVRENQDVPIGAPMGLVGEPLPLARASQPVISTSDSSRVRVMEGSLAEFDVPTLLQTIGMGRAYIELDVFSQDGRAIGSVFVKSGKVVSAQAGDMEGIQAIRELLDSPKNYQFAVFRIDPQASASLATAEPLGGLHHVLMDAQPRGARPTRPQEYNAVEAQPRGARPTKPQEFSQIAGRTPVMEGLLSEFDVPTLLQTLGSGRQFLGLELSEHGKVVGTIHVKSGMVIAATTGTMNGFPAFRKLINLPGHCQFNVYRSTGALPTEEPIGPIHRLLMNATEPVETNGATKHPPAAVHAPTLMGIAPAVTPPAPAPTPAPAAPAVAAPTPRLPEPEPIPSGPDRVPVMSGSVADFGVRMLLETLTTNRQHTLVEIVRGQKVLGNIQVKAGMVCSARTDSHSGRAAFETLINVPNDCKFRVYRRVGAVSINDPLGTVLELLAAPATAEPMPVVSHSATHHVAEHVEPRKQSRVGIWISAAVVVVAAAGFMLWNSTKDGSQRVASGVPERGVVDMPAPMPEPTVVAPVPTPEPEPVASPEPVAVKQPEPAPEPAAVKQPEPAAEPVAVKQPEPTPEPVAVKQPEPTPEPVAVKPAEPKPEPVAVKPPEVKRPPAVKEPVRRAQYVLRKLGYKVGPVDNIYGKMTKSALEEFQRAESLPETGELDDQTMRALAAKAKSTP